MYLLTSLSVINEKFQHEKSRYIMHVLLQNKAREAKELQNKRLELDAPLITIMGVQ